MKSHTLTVLLVLTLSIVFPTGGQATTFSNLLVFGDSLSDNGNIGRFTDGPIWVETLASSLGADLFDFAYGGATTDYDNPSAGLLNTGLQWQVDNYTGPIDGALFTVWAGANDLLQFRPFDIAASNIGTALDNLYADGARDILVGNLPDIGATPALISQGQIAAALATGWTLGFNSQLEAVVSDFEASHADVNLFRLNAYESFSAYAPGTPGWSNLFWTDGFHPSSAGHQLIADIAYNKVAPVPVPATMLLLGTGLLGLAGLRNS